MADFDCFFYFLSNSQKSYDDLKYETKFINFALIHDLENRNTKRVLSYVLQQYLITIKRMI